MRVGVCDFCGKEFDISSEYNDLLRISIEVEFESDYEEFDACKECAKNIYSELEKRVKNRKN